MNIPYFERPLFFFDQSRFRRSLGQADGKLIPIFKDALNAANVQFDTRFAEGEEIRSLIYERALFIDCILHYAWHQFEWSDKVCLIAVGGYGRGELHPRSDIDLLLLMQEEVASDLESAQSLLMLLWDIGLDIGHSVRTIDQCVDIAREDITVATNVMECRTVVGNKQLCLQLQQLTQPDNLWPADQFFKAKYDEQDARHHKHNNTEYNLEPNIKNAPGGLRDIQTIGWVAKRYYGVRTLRQLAGKDFFTEEEFALLLSGEEFLWKVRYGLHKLAGRAEERLLFDFQRQLAAEFGYKDTDSSLAVEQFMHKYYRVVLSLRELNDVLLHFLDEAVLNRNGNATITPLNERFQLRDNYIEVTHPDVFLEDPSALLEIFVLMGHDHKIVGVRPETIRLLREHRNLIDDNFRNDSRNTALFLELLKSDNTLVTQLRRMKRYNILGRYLPEFGQIIGQMQHDLFHIYTVDAHTLWVVKNMRLLRLPEAKEKFSVAHEIINQLNKPELLYIAGLYHDIAKGRGGDHSELGAVDAYDFCIRHGLKKHEANMVSWLVKNHLLMSQVSQKRDLSDPDVIHEFAVAMGDQPHLDYLYVLTVADINATNPTLWTTWRASLMRQLYNETKRALRRGLENPVDRHDLIEETQEAAMQLLLEKGFEKASVQKLWGYLGDDYFLRESARDITWQSEAIIQHHSQDDLILVRETTSRRNEGATEIFIRTKDRSNVFAAVASALDHLRLSIQDARIYNTERGGYTIDTFYVLDEDNLPIGNDPQKVERIKKALAEELALVDDYRDIISRRTPRVLKNFAIPTRTSLSNDIHGNTTVLEVISPDRPGLLALIARIFLQFNLQIDNAKIATLGERVEDIFYITNEDGHPLSDPELCEQLQQELCRELDRQVEDLGQA
ncbi:[protein-PII] uridylyltransferase [Pseudomaricurvus alkylphenolicus]|uniref:[protein-PII] uridylyltransferase n=1 Tax=Pseudomaricurvus alkylphenolicus TaxID=1306991 RepID=UPI00141F14B0|nr:[protein-PII] uridylyltransferase [Pseudomaricurvus alkylphenolicus]NIB39856.1 [protein-PII] uridylyltransferase [Pseudomaricurvus alkylphenolicus]